MRHMLLILSVVVCLVSLGCGDKPQGTKPTGVDGSKATSAAK